jgi:hypothetical protein
VTSVTGASFASEVRGTGNALSATTEQAAAEAALFAHRVSLPPSDTVDVDRIIRPTENEGACMTVHAKGRVHCKVS